MGKTIGCDLDGVLYDYYSLALDFFNLRYSTDYSIKDWKDFDGKNLFKDICVFDDEFSEIVQYCDEEIKRWNGNDDTEKAWGVELVRPLIFYKEMENPKKEYEKYWNDLFNTKFFLHIVHLYSDKIPKLIDYIRGEDYFHIITSRSKMPNDNYGNVYRTYSRLIHDKIHYDKIFFEKDKTKFANSLYAYIDDCFDTAVKMIKANPALKMYLVTRPWNEQKNVEEHGIKRVNSFEEFVEILDST